MPCGFIKAPTNLLGANIFVKDKAKVKEAIRLYQSGIDGWHRLEAYKREGIETIPVKYDSGYSLSANHGIC